MTKLIKLLNVELMNLEDSMRGRFSNSDFDASTQIRDMIERYKDKEDIEVREYINEEDFYLYNIHTTETSLYVEKYDAVMSFDVEIEKYKEYHGKKIGTYIDYGDGAPEVVEYISKEAEQDMMRLVIEYAKEHPNQYVVNIYKARPQQFQKECERFKKYHPYIPDEDITIETMASNSIVYIVEDFLKLYDLEKQFKRYQKKGYRAISVAKNQVTAYPASWSDEKIKEEAKEEKLYMSLDDFIAA